MKFGSSIQVIAALIELAKEIGFGCHAQEPAVSESSLL